VKKQDSRIPIAIVGLSFGKGIIDQLQQPPASSLFRLAAVCDLRREAADESAERYGVKAYHSLQELLRDPSIPAVGLFTRPEGRADLLRQILDAGKDVITTKPFELDPLEAGSVLRHARELGRVIHLNSPSPRLTPDLEQIELWRSEFDLGRLVSARGEVWASYFERADDSWMDDPCLCPAGPMMRLGIYLVNDIIRLAGRIASVNVITSRIRTGRPTPDNALISIVCASGCLASVYASFCVDDGDRYSNGLILNFERGTLYRNVGSDRLFPGSGKAQLSLVTHDHGVRRVAAQRVLDECSGVYQWEQFHQAVQNREPIAETYIEQIVEGVQLLDTIRHQTTAAPLVAAHP